MKWTRVLIRHGLITEDAGVAYDPFYLAAKQAQDSGLPHASISFNGLGTSLEYGAVKCSVSVTIHCAQQETAIDMAAEIAFRKAVELANDGASHLGLPLLPVPEDL